MKNTITIVVGYPPIESDKGTPLLSQNRQFQYFHEPTYIYPMVPASAATNLAHHGYTAYWMDGIAEKKTYDLWFDELRATGADFLLLETKSPIVKRHCAIIEQVKRELPGLSVILVGDHATYAPQELFEQCPVDFVITGGDYDFAVVNLLNHISNREVLEGGIYWRKGDARIRAIASVEQTLSNGGSLCAVSAPWVRHPLDTLPFIDRDLTKWELYAYENGNYKYTPATYMYSGRDCWWNRCTFCVWDHTINPIGSYRSFSPERLFAEVTYVVDRYGVKEIFDDAGTFFVGPKLTKFCNLLIESGYNKKVRYGCNMRFNALKQDAYDLMRRAGFRFILYGMESGNQKTLDRLEKGTKEEDTINGARMASQAGLEPHATIMLGYPWESYEDAKRTIDVAKYCFRNGYFNTMQATIVIPYPGTPLYKECKEKGWLLTDDYERFDMREPVMKIPFSSGQLLDLEQELYTAFLSPRYLVRKVLSVRSAADAAYLFSMAKKLCGHLLDFDPHQRDASWTSLTFWRDAVKKFAHHLTHSAEENKI